MKKIYKIITGCALSLIMVLSSISGVSAAQSLGYSATVATGGNRQLITTTTPEVSYKWALNYLTSIEGGKVTSMYYTLYMGLTYVEAGGDLTLLSSQDGYSAIWTPTSATGVPLVFGENPVAGDCDGYNTNASYCALPGYSYRLYLKNTGTTTTTVSGQFTLTER